MCIDVHEELVIGNIKTGEVFIFCNVGFVSTADFNFWAAFNAYNKDDGYNKESNLDFADYLADCELAKTFPSDVEGNPDLVDELNAAEDLWNSYDANKQLSLAFEEFTNLVSIEDLKEFVELVPNARELGLNDAQIFRIASNLSFEQQGLELRHILKMADAAKAIDKEYMIDVVRAINFVAFQAHEAEVEKAQGYVVRAVFPTTEDGFDFAYSQGGDEKVGFEAICAMRGIPCRTLAVFVDNFITLASQDEDFDPLVINKLCGKLQDGTPLRLKAIEADAKALLAADMNIGPLHNSLRVIQILVPDSNNVLPDEEGYNSESFAQPIYPLTSGDATLN